MTEGIELAEDAASAEVVLDRFSSIQSDDRLHCNERMARVLGGYFRTFRDDTLAIEVDRLLDGAIRADAARQGGSAAGRLDEGRALVVMGAAGAGKSRALQRTFLARKEFAGLGDPNADCPLVSISAPSPCTLKQLGLSLLKGLGYETVRDMRENVAWEKVRHQLRARGVQFVHIDEAQHAIEFMQSHERQKVSDTLKDIMHGGDGRCGSSSPACPPSPSSLRRTASLGGAAASCALRSWLFLRM